MTSDLIPENGDCDLCDKTIQAINAARGGWTDDATDKWIGIDAHGLPTLYQGTRFNGVGHFPVFYGDTDIRLDRTAALEEAKNWLDSCVNQDVGVCRPDQEGSLPRRLLCLGDRRSPTIRLVDVSQDKDPVEYKFAALSYRWGVRKEDIVRTTTENIDDHLNSIVVETLPQTIIDAVKVSRELDIPYLWVDSLCIIQARDGVELEADEVAHRDWQEEGSNMQNTYAKSWLTIYAEDASCCTAGFLGDCKFGYATRNSDFDHYVSDDSSHEYTEAYVVEGSVLRFRGWCLQEYLASHRRLRFYEAEMVWECNCRYRCQCTHVDSEEPNDKFLDFRTGAEAEGPSNHVSLWHKIVEDYSGREVFDPEENKLMAIAAAANIIREITEDRYLKGLWQSELLKGLGWKTLAKNPNREYRRLARSAPTWSWASIDGPVAFTPHPSNYHSSNHNMVQHYHTVAAQQADDTDSPALEGPLLPVQLASQQEEEPDRRPLSFVRLQGGEIASEVALDWDDMEGVLRLESDQAKTCWSTGNCECRPDMHRTSDSEQFFALQLHTWRDEISRARMSYRNGRPAKGRAPSEVWFLILQRVEDPCTYKRVGIGCHNSHDWATAEQSRVTLI